MSAETKTTRLPGLMRWLLPVLVSLLAFWFLLRNFDPQGVAVSFHSVSLPALLLAILLFLVGLSLRAWCWKIMLGPGFSYKTAFLGLNAGYLMNNVLPLRLGEFGRAILLSGTGPDRGSFGQVFAAVLSERVLDIFLAALFALVVLPLLVTSDSIRVAAIVAFLLALGLMVAAGIGAMHKDKVLAWAEVKVKSRKGWRSKFVALLGHLLNGFSFFAQPSRWISAFLLLVLSWVCSMVQLYILQSQVLQHMAWWWPVLVVSAGAFINALPSAPAGIGVFEAATVGAYALIGVGQSPALVLAIILHIIQFVIPGLFGLVGITLLGNSLTALFRKSLNLKDGQEQQQ